MPFLDNVLQTLAYGWQDQHGDLMTPTTGQIFK